MKRMVLALLLLCCPLLAQSRLSYDDPYRDYLLCLDVGEGSGNRTMGLDLTFFLPDSANFTLTVLHTAVVAVAGVGLGTAYVGFRDEQNNFITHVLSCWSQAGYGKGNAGFHLPRADTISPKQFRILSNDFWLSAENVQGGALIRLEHPWYRDWCLPIHGASDSLTQNATWVQGWIGFSGQKLSTNSATEKDLVYVDLGSAQPVRHLKQRLEFSISAPATAQLRSLWSKDGTSWNEFYKATGLSTSTTVANTGVVFSEPQNIRYVKVTGKSDGIAVVQLTPFKLFCWG